MALTLREAITANQTTIDVNGTDALSNGDLKALESETISIVTANPLSIQPGGTAGQRLSVRRGVLGTTEAAHDAGTSMTTASLGTGGGVTVDNTVDTPSEVTSLVIPNATIVGSEATVPIAVFSTTVTLTDADIKALPTTNFEILPPPGPGFVLVYVGGFAVCDTTENEYVFLAESGFAEPNIRIYGGASDTASVPVGARDFGPLSTFLGGFDPIAVSLPPAARVAMFDAAATGASVSALGASNDFNGQGLWIAAQNGGADPAVDFTGGDPANTMRVTVLYMLVAL